LDAVLVREFRDDPFTKRSDAVDKLILVVLDLVKVMARTQEA